MTNTLAKSLMTTALISTGFIVLISTGFMAQAEKPALFNHLPQDSLLIMHTNNAKKEIDLYQKTQLYKELEAIEYKKIIEELQTANMAQNAGNTDLYEFFNKENRELFLTLLDSSFSFTIQTPKTDPINSSDFENPEHLIKKLTKNSILQFKPNNADPVNELIKKLTKLAEKAYSRSEANGFVINQFTIDEETKFFILEKSDIFTITLDAKSTIKLLNSPLDKNMNNLEGTQALYKEDHDAVAYVNIQQITNLIPASAKSLEIRQAMMSINYLKEYRAWSDYDLDQQSLSSTFTALLNKNVPSHIKTLIKNSRYKTKTSGFFAKDTALFYAFSGMPFEGIVNYFSKQNNISVNDLLESNPALGMLYNKLLIALGKDYGISVSGVKPGLIPIPLATLAVEVKSEPIMKELITNLLSPELKKGSFEKSSKTVKGTEITILISQLPGATPAYMFYKDYLFISTDPTLLIKILNQKSSESLQASENFKKVTSPEKEVYQITYINGTKLFGSLEKLLKSLVPLLAQSTGDQIIYTKFVIPIVKAFKNLEAVGHISEATSEKELNDFTKVYIK